MRVQLDRTSQFQSIPPLLPAYNKYMGGVDRLSQVRETYGFDRKSKRYWIRPFFQFFYYAINNAYLLYKDNCKLFDMPPKELLDFRADLVKLQVGIEVGIESDQWSLKVRVIPENQVVVPSIELEKLA